MAKTFYQPLLAEYTYFKNKIDNKEYVVGTKENAPKIIQQLKEPTSKGQLGVNMLPRNVEVLIPQDPAFSILIPKIGANARVLSNVDSSDSTTYLEALQKGVAHAEGTAFPGEAGHIFMFAHSTDYFWNVGTYNAVFYLLYKLDTGDEVDLFYQGQRYVYLVSGKEIVDPSQVEYLTRQTSYELLTLQTCWPPGTTIKRLLVFAKRKAE